MKIFPRLFLCTALGVLFLGCPNAANDTEAPEEEVLGDPDDLTFPGGTEKTLNFEVAYGEVKYFSLAGGKQISKPEEIKSQGWDIAFEGTRLIYTNSGETAKKLDSGGKGGVWFTESTGLEGITRADAVSGDPLYEPYHEDVIRYVQTMSPVAPRRMNVMTFLGYGNEKINDGITAGKYFSNDFRYDKRPYYTNVGLTMPPNFQPTLRVYIIRHGDGIRYSKLQVTEFRRTAYFEAGSDVYKITYHNY
jgi:hypothetical protein